MERVRLRPLDRGDHQPLYRQVKQAILDLVQDGVIAPNAKLPSERELVAAYDVSRITIRQALVELVQEGHLQSQPGKGFYVTERQEGFELHLLTSFTANAIAKGMMPGSRTLEAKIYAAPPEVTRALYLPASAEVVLLKRLRTLDGVPVVIQYDWLQPAICPGLLDLDWSSGNRSLYAELRERYDQRPVRGQTTISARCPDAEEEELLKLEANTAVLTLDQIAFNAANRPINISTSIHHPKRYPLSIQQGE
ncbi:GntR family transcriptional regulator [Ensifer sp. ENS06]|uniref:GntR family transcriptional regulator n=1 Tax=Ensifer sp. ENS06 TaxID=2769276 RepID=UPI000DE19BD0|nr:GntR family transcriptional regulator [Ensifer sp. ENS06]MBD9626343.1 GntR family transcriptional regulator [Ensifer sp. ENS06]